MDTVEELNGTYFYKGVANISAGELFSGFFREGANKQVISSQADSLIKISRIW
ncbi:STM2901 family protein, partial [Klebsiella pneumoniae]